MLDKETMEFLDRCKKTGDVEMYRAIMEQEFDDFDSNNMNE